MKILVVEDEGVIRGELARFLQQHGYAITEAGTVDEALALGPSRFDAILADVRLPGRPGTDLVGKVGGRPVILMTSYATVQGAVGSMRMGAVDYLSKPFDLEELLRALRRITDGRPGVDATAPPEDTFGILGNSPPMVSLRARVRTPAGVGLKEPDDGSSFVNPTLCHFRGTGQWEVCQPTVPLLDVEAVSVFPERADVEVKELEVTGAR